MVEKKIQQMDYPRKTEFWKALPKKVMYQIFCMIIDYLEQSGKIIIDEQGCILRAFNSEMIGKLQSSKVKFR